ncbi:MAG: hypothetical protein U5M50_14100, partial [Sphingobium sp.]|nr:hypothetical protein [Sphingobium sp.]
MATSPAITPDIVPNMNGLPVMHHSMPAQLTAYRRRREIRCYEGIGGNTIGGESRACVKTEPSEPQQAPAEDDQGKVVQGRAGESDAFAEDQGADLRLLH